MEKYGLKKIHILAYFTMPCYIKLQEFCIFNSGVTFSSIVEKKLINFNFLFDPVIGKCGILQSRTLMSYKNGFGRKRKQVKCSILAFREW